MVQGTRATGPCQPIIAPHPRPCLIHDEGAMPRGARPAGAPLVADLQRCGRAGRWEAALGLLRGALLCGAAPRVGIVVYSATISALGRCGEWRRALLLLEESRGRGTIKAKQTACTSATAPGSARARGAGSGSRRWRCSDTCGRHSLSRASSAMVLR
ncbi:unnamed protein product [Prorocentrum cordatum]|uniref:Pentatricopeptide repeat-containing protein n=1 Tax=Prorocentrum cordatum TaxID=2364126 RepID=A0ABN9YB43_9DINO|nr:unnamed protein product [Polarella glacialis]